MDYQRIGFTIKALKDLKDHGRLNVAPEYQRKSIWSEDARFGIIDSIYRGYPVPEIFVWNMGTHRSWDFEVIDGQQRLRAILDFLNTKGNDKKKNPKFKILQSAGSQIKIHDDLIGKNYHDLDEAKQKKIDNYEFEVRVCTSDDLEEIEELFKRLNTNVSAANAQELRNLIHGDMQALATSIAKDMRTFLKNNGIINDTKIKRMLDVNDIANEILLCATEGKIVGSTRKGMDDFYKSNKTFKSKKLVKNNVLKIQNKIERIFPGESIKTTIFTKHTNYLALFTTFYCGMIGHWKDDNGKNVKFVVPSNSAKIKKLRNAIVEFSTDVEDYLGKLAEDPKFNRKPKDVRNYGYAHTKGQTTNENWRSTKCEALVNTIWNYVQLQDAGPGPNATDRRWLWNSWKRKATNGNPLCARCGKEIKTNSDMDVGHKEMKHLGGKNERKNYQPEHKSCNRKINQLN